jgi:hypothetical protein
VSSTTHTGSSTIEDMSALADGVHAIGVLLDASRCRVPPREFVVARCSGVAARHLLRETPGSIEMEWRSRPMSSETVQLTIVGAPGEEIYLVLASERDAMGATARVAFRGVVGLDGTVEVAVRRSELPRAQIVRRPGAPLASPRDDEPLPLRTGQPEAATSRRQVPAALLARHAEQLRRTGWPNL